MPEYLEVADSKEVTEIYLRKLPKESVLQLCELFGRQPAPGQMKMESAANKDNNLPDERQVIDKFVVGYKLCALETKRFLLANGVSMRIFGVNNKNRSTSDSEDVEQDASCSCSRNKHNVSSVCCKREIMAKIRRRIFERRRQKMAGLRQQRESVWRPWC